MATWHGEPYPGFFKDACNNATFLNEPVTISNQWLPSHEEECDFAKLNSEMLTFIHEEKRFPSKEEYQRISLEALPKDCGFVTFEKLSFGVSGTSPAAGDTTITTYGEPLQWDGISWKEFIQDEELKKDLKKDYQQSALMSTKGVVERNFNNPLI